MSANEASLELLNAALRDLKALRHMLDVEAFEDEVFGFHAQQTAEKALKAWLHALAGSHPFTHDLGRLLTELEALGKSSDALWELTDLNAYAVRFRYESMPGGEESLDRGGIIHAVESLVAHVQQDVTAQAALEE